MPIMSATAIAVAVVVETVRLSGAAGPAADAGEGGDEAIRKNHNANRRAHPMRLSPDQQATV
jgi:hypothetical protein